jgi:regulator of protease activity HflC (stomatin/prohibitin superfamily)
VVISIAVLFDKEVIPVWIFKRIQVGDNERVLVFRYNRFIEILGPGEYWRFALPGSLRLERYLVSNPVFSGDTADYLVKHQPALAAEHFVVVETSDREFALVFLDGKLFRVAGAGSRVLFWKGHRTVTVEVVNASDTPEVDRDRIPALLELGKDSLAVFAIVEPHKVGLLYLDNRFERLLEPGTYGFWALRTPRVEAIDMRRQAVEVPGQEILTRDKVTLRVNVVAEYKVIDPVKAGTVVKSFTDHLYRQLQLALRQTLGKRTLDEVLAEKVDVDPAAAAEVRAEMASVGVEVGAIALKDIILPGEIREILNQVVAAEKQAQANLIRRREETAATRSLLNTANLMKDNPVLVRLKELETLERLTEKVGHLTVHGGLESLLTKMLPNGKP